MKKIVLLIALLITGIALHAQGQEAYIKAMTKGLEAMGKAQNQEDRQAAASQFERIAAKVTDQWHPQYYTALNYIMLSFNAPDLKAKDALTSKAQEYLDAALKLGPRNSEIVALQGYNYMAQLAADPNNRGQSLSPKAMQQFGKAMAIDKENPRAMALMAQMQYGMAQFFGSSTDDACNMAKKTLPMFEAQVMGQSLNPTWGKQVADSMIAQCSK